MKLDNVGRFELQVVVANKLPADYVFSYGDIFDSYADIQQEYPHDEYLYGYVVVDTLTGLVADGCNDWNDSVEDALSDYKEHCKSSYRSSPNKPSNEAIDWDVVVDALRYAAESRSYEAERPTDEEDKSSIQACAETWSKLADQIEACCRRGN